MSSQAYEKVKQNPRFAELVARRSRFALMLTALVLGSYYCFVAVVAFAPDLLRIPVMEGGTLTVGVPIGAVIIIGSWLLTGWYVKRANSEFDALNEAIVREAYK